MPDVTGLTIVLLIVLLYAVGVSWWTFFVCIAIAAWVVPWLEKSIRGEYGYKRV